MCHLVHEYLLQPFLRHRVTDGDGVAVGVPVTLDIQSLPSLLRDDHDFYSLPEEAELFWYHVQQPALRFEYRKVAVYDTQNLNDPVAGPNVAQPEAG